MIPAPPLFPACEPSPAANARPQEVAHTKTALIAMGSFVLAAWLLKHPYAGLGHDSILYTLMALARLHPDSLSHDIFLRFGSQDQYTLFGPLFSAAIRVLDLEPAAAGLTLASQAAFFICAWLFVRRFVSSTTALLATGLLVVLPSGYGSADFFHYTENFLTPRLPAEALVLAAITAALMERYAWAALSVLAALLLHPIMGAAGVAMLVFAGVAIARPRLVLGCIAVLLAASVAACRLGIAPFTSFGPADTRWFHIVSSTSPYLFVTNWSADDWSRLAVILAVPALGLLTADTRALRNICAGALLTAASGLALTALYCDALHVIFVTEVQPWRWLWATHVVAILLAPLIARNCLRAGSTARAAVLLLAAAWLFHDAGSRALCSMAAIAITYAAGRNAAIGKYARVIHLGACSLLALAAVFSLSEHYQDATIRVVSEPTGDGLVSWLQPWISDGLIPAGLLILTWWGLQRADNPARTMTLAAAGALACAALALPAWDAWTAGLYTRARWAEFSAWRKEIPVRAEVLWPVNPIGAWYLLERASYWSHYQAVGAVFSKSKALEIDRRNLTLGSLTDPASAQANSTAVQRGRPVTSPLTAIIRDTHSLQAACRNSDLDYVVSWNLLGPTPVAPAVIDAGKVSKRMYLYRCTDFRKSP